MRTKTPRWAAAIAGPEQDIAELAKHLAGPTRIYRGQEGWELSDARWESLEQLADVHAAIDQLTTHVRAVARLRLGHGRPIRYAGNIFERAGRNRHKHVFPAAQRAGERPLATRTADTDSPPTPSWGLALDLARRDAAVARALDFFSVEPNWHTLDAALDPVRRDERTGGIEGIVRNGWATASELGRFTQAAQAHDAVGSQGRREDSRQAPGPPMTLAEAEKLVGGIVATWIERLGENPVTDG